MRGQSSSGVKEQCSGGSWDDQVWSKDTALDTQAESVQGINESMAEFETIERRALDGFDQD